jgi:PAS domain S-box-containing protein
VFPIANGARVDQVLELPQLGDVLVHGSLARHEVRRGERQLVIDARRVNAPAGSPDAVLVAVEDVTERRETERALQRHEYLLAAITDAVFSLDTSYKILTWNPAAERFFGYTAAEAIGKRTDEVVHVDESVDRAGMRKKLAAGEVVSSDTRIRHKDGEWIDVHSSTVPARDKHGKAFGYVVIMHDIRDAKAQERQLREHARIVEEANRELDGFTYSVSHDLRAPLRAIDGFSRILVEDHGEKMSKDEARLVAVIRKNTQQMGQLIDDLLAFARLGRKELAMHVVDMKALLIELVPEVLEGTEERLIDLRAGFLPAAVGDRALLKQVWLNLLANAVKYTRKRERAIITIAGEVAETELVYKVEDNGAGFDMQYVGKLFGVFQRLHRSAEFEGTGVGLALAQRIVRRHGGRMWAEGKEGVGATFWFALPRRGGVHG